MRWQTAVGTVSAVFGSSDTMALVLRGWGSSSYRDNVTVSERRRIAGAAAYVKVVIERRDVGNRIQSHIVRHGGMD